MYFYERPVLKTGGEINRDYTPFFKNLPDGYSYSGHLLTFTPKNDTTLTQFADESIRYTKYYRINNYLKSFIAINELKTDMLIKGNTYLVPNIENTMVYNVFNNANRDTFARSVYFSSKSINSAKMVKQLIKDYKAAGINSVVFDVKDVPGFFSYKSRVKEVIEYDSHKYRGTDDISKMIRLLKENGIYVIARISCFRDMHMTRNRPDWAIRNTDGSIWNHDKGEIWLDPTNNEVQDYTIRVAEEAASYGVDEIQFDYIRFPTEKESLNAIYVNHNGIISRTDTITGFLNKAYSRLKKMDVLVSIDIFGVVAWGYEGDIKSTGQDIAKLSQYCDIICPMLYPSHFNNNFRGIAKPGDSPYYFISEGVTRVKKQSGKTMVRPWLQAFGWRVSNYDASYIQEQIKASIDTKSEGYIFWNAKNSYDTVIDGMEGLNSLYK